MKEKPEHASYREDDENKKKVHQENVGNFMSEISTEEIFALHEEIECELFNTPLKYDKEKYSRQGIFPKPFWNFVVEEQLKEHSKDNIYQNGKWQLVEEVI